MVFCNFSVQYPMKKLLKNFFTFTLKKKNKNHKNDNDNDGGTPISKEVSNKLDDSTNTIDLNESVIIDVSTQVSSHQMQKDLCIAVSSGNIKEIDSLIKKGASFFIGHTSPLQLAIDENKLEVIQHFIKNTEDGKTDATRFMLVCKASSYFTVNADILDVLVREQVSLDLKDTLGRTPLMQIIIDGSRERGMKWLLNRGADKEARDNKLKTPLMHTAVREDRRDEMKILLQYGADVFALDNKNLTVFDYAKKREDHKMLQYLLKSVIDVQSFTQFWNKNFTEEEKIVAKKAIFSEQIIKKSLRNFKQEYDCNLIYTK